MKTSILIAGVGEALRDDDSPALEIHLPHAGLDERQRQARVELEHVVRRVVEHVPDAAEHAAALLLDGEPDELEE